VFSQSKAAWRFASRRTPKMGAACSKSWHNSAVGWEYAKHILAWRVKLGERFAERDGFLTGATEPRNLTITHVAAL